MGTLSCDPAPRLATAPLGRRVTESQIPETGLRKSCGMATLENGLEVTPGPGAYSPEKVPPVRHRTPPAFTLGCRLPPKPLDTSAPAPNTYTMPPLWGSQIFTKPRSPSYTVVGRTPPVRPPQDPAEIPGPGQYDSPDANTYRQRLPAFTMLGRPRAPRPLEETPGPGAHCPEQVTVNKARAPAFSMGIRHSKRASTMAAATPSRPSGHRLPGRCC
uniref:CIMAP1 family member D n=1 Tax=Macaca nemestrina TaxID=9545 RepID=A0A2K6CEJ8_MACNE